MSRCLPINETTPEVEVMAEDYVGGSDSESDSDTEHPLFDALNDLQFEQMYGLIESFVEDSRSSPDIGWLRHWESFWETTKQSWKRQKL